MTAPGEPAVWSAPRLAARLAELRGVAPAPTCYLVWRATARSGVAEVAGYELPGVAGRSDETAFERWLAERNLAREARLTVSVLVIREYLDGAGLPREGVLERRRGGVDGPYYGKIARVEFAGPARQMRRYQALRDGRLAEAPPDRESGGPALDDLDAESFAGEDAVVLAHLGGGAIILDRRAPSLFEDNLGLSGIIHARRPDGREVGCGVGWHGTVAFVLVADFPRHGRPLLPPPELEAAVEKTIRARNLIRHETRLDDLGFLVIARRRGQQALVAIRWDRQAAKVEPYIPGKIETATEDQRRWMTYAETYEARAVLDSWRNGEDGEICVLAIDPAHEAWRHTIDGEGIETGRVSYNEAAAAVLYRERMGTKPDEATPDAGASEPIVSETAVPEGSLLEESGGAPELPAPIDSLLTKVRAWSHVTALLTAAKAARDAGVPRGQTVPRAALDPLRALPGPLIALNARFSAGSLRKLLRQAEAGAMTLPGFATALEELAARLSDELELTRVVLLPLAPTSPEEESPFGPEVELYVPAAAYDIEEAVRCLALRRATASVLHAMNAMRHGVECLLSAPKVTDLAWPRLIEAVSSAAPPEVTAALIQVRRVLRGRGLAAVGKYTEEEAETILAATEGFMRVLAACLAARKGPPG